jgi:hypothetical protein
METALAWLLNLDADDELADPRSYQASPEMERRIAGLIEKMRLLLAPSDLVLNGKSPVRLGDVRALAFCPTPSACARIAQLGLRAPKAPPLEVLRTANDRAFSAAVGQTLPGARFVTQMAELEAALRGASPTGDFILKRPFGFAGRERRKAVAGCLDASTQGFASKTFERGQGLQVEPWLTRAGDYALHGFLLENGAFSTGPLVEQQCDAMGRWQASALAAHGALKPEEWAALQRELERCAHALHAIGYFGPFGIDAFRYRTGTGSLDFQPRSEINARFTMGYPRSLLEWGLNHDR